MEDYKPKFSERFRAGIYLSGVGVAFASFVTAGTAAVVMKDPTAVVTVAGLVGTGWGAVCASFGVAYRPTR